jgi:short-subunit dehydrogenase
MNWRVHVLAHVHAARVVVPRMASRGSGAFVVTASAAGLLSMTRSATYTVTKHAAVAFAEWLAIANGDDGLRVHCVCPLGVQTPMVSADKASQAEAVSSGEILTPEAVADASLDAIRTGRFLVLPHPEVQTYENAKVADRDRWIAGMRRLRQRSRDSRG